jgi:hypothetical protein
MRRRDFLQEPTEDCKENASPLPVAAATYGAADPPTSNTHCARQILSSGVGGWCCLVLLSLCSEAFTDH